MDFTKKYKKISPFAPSRNAATPLNVQSRLSTSRPQSRPQSRLPISIRNYSADAKASIKRARSKSPSVVRKRFLSNTRSEHQSRSPSPVRRVFAPESRRQPHRRSSLDKKYFMQSRSRSPTSHRKYLLKNKYFHRSRSRSPISTKRYPSEKRNCIDLQRSSFVSVVTEKRSTETRTVSSTLQSKSSSHSNREYLPETRKGINRYQSKSSTYIKSHIDEKKDVTKSRSRSPESDRKVYLTGTKLTIVPSSRKVASSSKSDISSESKQIVSEPNRKMPTNLKEYLAENMNFAKAQSKSLRRSIPGKKNQLTKPLSSSSFNEDQFLLDTNNFIESYISPYKEQSTCANNQSSNVEDYSADANYSMQSKNELSASIKEFSSAAIKDFSDSSKKLLTSMESRIVTSKSQSQLPESDEKVYLPETRLSNISKSKQISSSKSGILSETKQFLTESETEMSTNRKEHLTENVNIAIAQTLSCVDMLGNINKLNTSPQSDKNEFLLEAKNVIASQISSFITKSSYLLDKEHSACPKSKSKFLNTKEYSAQTEHFTPLKNERFASVKEISSADPNSSKESTTFIEKVYLEATKVTTKSQNYPLNSDVKVNLSEIKLSNITRKNHAPSSKSDILSEAKHIFTEPKKKITNEEKHLTGFPVPQNELPNRTESEYLSASRNQQTQHHCEPNSDKNKILFENNYIESHVSPSINISTQSSNKEQFAFTKNHSQQLSNKEEYSAHTQYFTPSENEWPKNKNASVKESLPETVVKDFLESFKKTTCMEKIYSSDYIPFLQSKSRSPSPSPTMPVFHTKVNEDFSDIVNKSSNPVTIVRTPEDTADFRKSLTRSPPAFSIDYFSEFSTTDMISCSPNTTTLNSLEIQSDFSRTLTRSPPAFSTGCATEFCKNSQDMESSPSPFRMSNFSTTAHVLKKTNAESSISDIHSLLEIVDSIKLQNKKVYSIGELQPSEKIEGCMPLIGAGCSSDIYNSDIFCQDKASTSFWENFTRAQNKSSTMTTEASSVILPGLTLIESPTTFQFESNKESVGFRSPSTSTTEGCFLAESKTTLQTGNVLLQPHIREPMKSLGVEQKCSLNARPIAVSATPAENKMTVLSKRQQRKLFQKNKGTTEAVATGSNLTPLGVKSKLPTESSVPKVNASDTKSNDKNMSNQNAPQSKNPASSLTAKVIPEPASEKEDLETFKLKLLTFLKKELAAKYSDPVTSKQTNLNLKLYLINSNHPAEKLVGQNIFIIREKILSKIDEIPAGKSLPRIYDSKLWDGVITFYIGDIFTAEWLVENFHNNDKVISGSTLKFLYHHNIPNYVRITFRTFDVFTKDPKDIIRRLNRYNPQLKTASWRFHRMLDQKFDSVICWVFNVGSESAEAIKNAKFIGYSGLDSVKFKIIPHPKERSTKSSTNKPIAKSK